MRRISALSLLVVLAACTGTPAERQARIQQALKVACDVDGTLVPIAQPIVASLGHAGAAVASADLLVHPEVVAACAALSGTPASATPVGSPQTVSTDTAAAPAS